MVGAWTIYYTKVDRNIRRVTKFNLRNRPSNLRYTIYFIEFSAVGEMVSAAASVTSGTLELTNDSDSCEEHDLLC